jgi:hypothetical protein
MIMGMAAHGAAHRREARQDVPAARFPRRMTRLTVAQLLEADAADLEADALRQEADAAEQLDCAADLESAAAKLKAGAEQEARGYVARCLPTDGRRAP